MKAEDLLKDIDNHIFRPKKSLENWLHNYKRPYSIAGMQFPGLFNSHNFYYHRAMFFIALIIEIIGSLVLALDIGAGLGLIGAIVGSVGFVMDFGIAFILLFFNGDIVYFANKRILFTGADGTVSEIDDKIKATKNKKKVGYFIILLVAVVKIYFLYEGFGVFEMPIIVMGFLFIIAAIIHIRYTEYFFAFLRFKLSAIRDRNNNRAIGHLGEDSSELYTIVELIKFDAIPSKCPHSIIPTNELVDVKLSNGITEKRYKSTLISSGLMTDNDVETLCKSQGNGTRGRDLAIELLAFQLNDVAPSKKYLQFNQGLPIHIEKI